MNTAPGELVSDEGKPENLRRPGFLIRVTLIALLAEIGFDFMLHAGVLAGLYEEPSPFLLPLEVAFRRIPLGYLSFLFLTMLLVWLMLALGARGARAGAVFGLKLGAAIWGALALGLASIATAPPALLLGWFVGQTLELGLAGAVAGAAFHGTRPRTVFLRVLALFAACLVLGVLLQNLR